MSAFWAVFLLCSLLNPSQGLGIMSSVGKVDVDDIKHSLAKRDLQKLQGGLLGGKLLGGLLEKGSPLGSLLGEDGAVGSLLGREGAVGSLLGGDGVLGGLLGREGAVGSLLGGDGVLGGLLGRDGVLGGLLGRDGVLGGLLGKDGLVDGLLGKDGLVDGLLDVVLDILIGKGGLLGKDGLVGNLLGGNNGDLTGPKIVNNTLPKISLRSLPGFGHEVGFNTQLLLESTSAPGRALCVQVEADVVMLVQDKWAALQSNEDCKTLDINIRVRPKVPLLDQPLKSLLSDVLREVGCNIVNSRLNVASTLLGSRTPAFPLGALGNLPPFSIISSDAIQLDLNLLAGDAEGGMVTSTQGPPLAATVLLATGHPPLLRLPQRTLSALLEPMQGQGAFSLSITDSMVPDSISLSTSALLPLIPQLAKVLPGSLPLELRVRVANKPVVAVRDRRATATLKASVDVLSPLLQSSQKLLFSLDTDIVLNITPSVSDGKLQTSLALDSINLTRAPLRLDPLSVSPLAGWLKQVLAAAYVPAINDALRVSVPLPNILNTSLRNARVDITDADDSLNQTSLKGSCSGGPSTLLAV
uniref:Lipid-binding serum glycoprotein C-terminal domain-containing protein n=1 Tax=Accipiter nisus TaxID=211598 RepID=A0A8B9MT34_9AVES